jgi:protein TonB
MSAARARKLLIAAFAISLLLHLVLAGYLRWPFNVSSSESAVVKVHQITLTRIIPHTPPPPTPAPTPHATPAVKSSVAPPAVQPHRGKGVPVAHGVVPVPSRTAAATATPAPTPSATAVAQACAQHDISPAVTATADPVDIPPEARASKASGTAAIQVQIDPQGRVTTARVSQSSGSAGLDAVAMQMAKSATYSPALVRCKAVSSTYTFSVKFVAW